jgi:hypothetical protein
MYACNVDSMTVSFIFNFLKLTPLWEVSLYIQVQIIYIIHLKGTETALYWQSFDFLTVFLLSSERNKIGNFHQDESFSWINYIIWMMNFRQMFGKLILYLFFHPILSNTYIKAVAPHPTALAADNSPSVHLWFFL